MKSAADSIITDKEILHQISHEITQDEVKKFNLVNRLCAANLTAWTQGRGLAAIQIGLPFRFAWYIDSQGKERVLFNPRIIAVFGTEVKKEGCLSIPNTWVETPRAVEIIYITNGHKKKARDFEARLIQHEIDHMDGRLICD